MYYFDDGRAMPWIFAQFFFCLDVNDANLLVKRSSTITSLLVVVEAADSISAVE